MVKIRDLTDPQLEQQISKYQKLLDELNKEKDRRLIGTNPKVKVDPDANLATSELESPFQLNFDDQELAKITKDAEKQKQNKKMDEDEMRVTQLLQLNTTQLAELQKNAEKLRSQQLKKKAASSSAPAKKGPDKK